MMCGDSSDSGETGGGGGGPEDNSIWSGDYQSDADAISQDAASAANAAAGYASSPDDMDFGMEGRDPPAPAEVDYVEPTPTEEEIDAALAAALANPQQTLSPEDIAAIQAGTKDAETNNAHYGSQDSVAPGGRTGGGKSLSDFDFYDATKTEYEQKSSALDFVNKVADLALKAGKAIPAAGIAGLLAKGGTALADYLGYRDIDDIANAVDAMGAKGAGGGLGDSGGSSDWSGGSEGGGGADDGDTIPRMDQPGTPGGSGGIAIPGGGQPAPQAQQTLTANPSHIFSYFRAPGSRMADAVSAETKPAADLGQKMTAGMGMNESAGMENMNGYYDENGNFILPKVGMSNMAKMAGGY